MNIADNPISKPYLGGVIVLLAYLEIRISDTLGWPQGMFYKLDLQYSRHMYTVGRFVTVVSIIFQSQWSSYDISLRFSVKGQAKF